MLCQTGAGSSVILQVMHSTAVGVLLMLLKREHKGLSSNEPAAVPDLYFALSCLEMHNLLYIGLGSTC